MPEGTLPRTQLPLLFANVGAMAAAARAYAAAQWDLDLDPGRRVALALAFAALVTPLPAGGAQDDASLSCMASRLRQLGTHPGLQEVAGRHMTAPWAQLPVLPRGFSTVPSAYLPYRFSPLVQEVVEEGVRVLALAQPRLVFTAPGLVGWGEGWGKGWGGALGGAPGGRGQARVRVGFLTQSLYAHALGRALAGVILGLASPGNALEVWCRE